MIRKPNNISSKLKYSQYRKILHSLISKATKNFTKDYIDKNRLQSKYLWKHVADICSQHKPEREIKYKSKW